MKQVYETIQKHRQPRSTARSDLRHTVEQLGWDGQPIVTEPAAMDEAPFSRSVIESIAREAKITDSEQRAMLTERLDYLATHYRNVLSTMPNNFDQYAPFDATLTNRVEWLDTEVLNPLKRVIEAVSPENQAWFSLWPNDVIDELKPDYGAVRAQLENLQLMARNVVINLLAYRRIDQPFNEFLSFHIVTDIAKLLDNVAPHLKASRGTYSKEHGEFIGRYPTVIRQAFQTITGKAESLDRLINELVDQRRQK